MRKSQLSALVSAALAMVVLLFVLVLLLLKGLWAWIVPDLFPGAVEQGLIARHITWFAAAKVAIVLALLGALIKGNGREHKRRVSRL